MIGFFVLYFGLGDAVLGRRVPHLIPFQRIAETLIIFAGADLRARSEGRRMQKRFYIRQIS